MCLRSAVHLCLSLCLCCQFPACTGGWWRDISLHPKHRNLHELAPHTVNHTAWLRSRLPSTGGWGQHFLKTISESQTTQPSVPATFSTHTKASHQPLHIF